MHRLFKHRIWLSANNLFAAEPQFFASSLLPAFFASIFLHRGKKSKMATATLILTSVAIALTFSRGAFLAIATALGCCGAVVLRQETLCGYENCYMRGYYRSQRFLLASCCYESRPRIYTVRVRTSLTTLSARRPTIHGNYFVATKNGACGCRDQLQTNPVLTEIPTPTTTTETTTQSFVREGFVEESSNDRMSCRAPCH